MHQINIGNNLLTEREIDIIRMALNKELRDFKFLYSNYPSNLSGNLIKEYEVLLEKLNEQGQAS